MTNNNDFLPSGYEAPSGNQNYMRLEKGENRFRVLSKPIIGWLDWKDNKPLRFEYSNKPQAPIDPSKPIRHFWAMVVWNYKTSSVQILELTQKTIQMSMQSLINDVEWGSPFNYDIKISKIGDGKETEYNVNPAPAKPLSDEIKNIYQSMIIDLPALYSGEDPFAMNTKPTTKSQF